MNLEQAVWRDAERLSGKTCFIGTRIPISTLFDYAKANELDQFYEDFPDVSTEMVTAVLDASQLQLERLLGDAPAA